MKERPILFSAPLVRAILDGSKTQTRRAVKGWVPCEPENDGESDVWEVYNGDTVAFTLRCPYGNPGDRLWCRETFGIDDEDGSVLYFADPGTAQDAEHARACEDRYPRRRPSIHMPRWASRILLEITAVRVERLQDISEDDARAEGIPPGGLTQMRFEVPGMSRAHYFDSARDAFSVLWELINGAGSWAENPWVWVVEFRRVEPTEGA